MKKFIGAVALATGILFGSSVFAADLKIGYVDINGVALQSTWGKRVVEQLKKEQEKLSGDFELKAKTFKTAKEEYDKKKDVMDDKTKTKKQAELQTMAAELEKLASESSQQYNKQAQEVKAPLFQKITEILSKIGKDDKYDFIFEKGSLPYASDKNDLTKRVAAELDKTSPK